MNGKNVEMLAENLADISARHIEFTKAFVDGDREKLVTLFCESQYHCISLLADICDDPKMKLMLMEGELSCRAKLEEFEETIRKLDDQKRDTRIFGETR